MRYIAYTPSRHLHAGAFSTVFARHMHDDEFATPAQLLETAYQFVAADASVDAFRLVCSASERGFANQSTSVSNELLRLLEPDRAGAFLSLGLVRSTYRARDHLDAWRPCVDRVLVHLVRAGDRDAVRDMRGLLPKEELEAAVLKAQMA